jgi:hypothetical protein
MTIPIANQIAAVEISAANLRGHIENLTELVERGRRNQLELDVLDGRLPALEAAAVTLRWLQSNEARIKGRAA